MKRQVVQGGKDYRKKLASICSEDEKFKKKKKPILKNKEKDISISLETIETHFYEQTSSVNDLPNQSKNFLSSTINRSSLLELHSANHSNQSQHNSEMPLESVKKQPSSFSDHSLSSLILNYQKSAGVKSLSKSQQLQTKIQDLENKVDFYSQLLKQKNIRIQETQKEKKDLQNKIKKLALSIDQCKHLMDQKIQPQPENKERNQLLKREQQLKEKLANLQKQQQNQTDIVVAVKKKDKEKVLQLLKLLIENKKMKSSVNFYKDKVDRLSQISSKNAELLQSLSKIRNVWQAL